MCVRLIRSFNKAVLFDGNIATTGAAFGIGDRGSLTFQKPKDVISKNAVLDMYSVRSISKRVRKCHESVGRCILDGSAVVA